MESDSRFEAGALTLEAPSAGTADVALSGDVVLRSTNTAEETARTSFTVSMLYKIMLPDFRGFLCVQHPSLGQKDRRTLS